MLRIQTVRDGPAALFGDAHCLTSLLHVSLHYYRYHGERWILFTPPPVAQKVQPIWHPTWLDTHKVARLCPLLPAGAPVAVLSAQLAALLQAGSSGSTSSPSSAL